MTKQIHLAAHFPGVNNTTVWSDPRSGSHIEFSSAGQRADRDRLPRAAVEPGPVRLRPGRPAAGHRSRPENTVARGRASVRMYRDPLATAAQWRAKAEAKELSIRELIIEVTGRQTFVGSPATVAGQINDLVQADASDGFILVPHITPGGLDEFADTVVPLLQERGVFRSDYKGSTLRDHLGLEPLKAAS